MQWAVGGLAFLWVTTRRRQVGIGYGWLLRSTFAAMAAAAAALAAAGVVDVVPAREVASVVTALAATASLAVSVVRRRAGVAGERTEQMRRATRVAVMTGGPAPVHRGLGREFPPALDAVAPLVGAVGLVAAGVDAGGPDALAVVRTLVGAGFLGAVTDAMLLGHWYLVQPGLTRDALHELNRWVIGLWPLEVAALLWPTGMASVLSGSIDDGYGGLLGWFWVACTVMSLALPVVTVAALRERAYSAVMAATGLLYLAILTAFGTDLVARALLA